MRLFTALLITMALVPVTTMAAPLGASDENPVISLGIGQASTTKTITTIRRTMAGNDVFDFSDELAGASGTGIDIYGTLNPAYAPDPFLSFTINASSFGSQMRAFEVLLQLPISTGNYSLATSSLGSSLTDLDANGAAATFISDTVLVNSVLVPALTLSNDDCEGTAPVAGGTIDCTGLGTATANLGSTVDLLSVDLFFDLTNRDLATFTGSVSLSNPTPLPPTSAVPEAATWETMVLGFGIFGALLRGKFWLRLRTVDGLRLSSS